MADSERYWRIPTAAAVIVIILLLACAGLTIALLTIKHPAQPVVQSDSTTPSPTQIAKVEQVPQSKWTRLVEIEHQRNLAAVASVKRRLDAKFREYIQRVPAFVESANSVKARLEMLKEILAGSFGKSAAPGLARSSFSETIVSGERFESDVSVIMQQFYQDIEANRTLVVSAVGRDFGSSGVSDKSMDENVRLLAHELFAEAQDEISKSIKEVPAATVRSLAGGVLLEELVRRRVTAAVASRDEKEAESKRAKVIGFAAGAIAGAANYYRLQIRFETKLSDNCRKMLEEVESNLWSDPEAGMEVSLKNFVDLTQEMHKAALDRAK